MGGLQKKAYRCDLFKLKNQPYWYYWVYDENLIRHRFSTGCRKKGEAMEELDKRKKEGTLIPKKNTLGSDTTLSQFGKDFWVYDKCPVVQGIIKRGGRYSPKVASANGGAFKNHIGPYLGKYRLAVLSPAVIEEWLLKLPDESGISNKTAKDVFTVLKQMLDYAVMEDLISSNPAKKVKALVRSSTRKAMGICHELRPNQTL